MGKTPRFWNGKRVRPPIWGKRKNKDMGTKIDASCPWWEVFSNPSISEHFDFSIADTALTLQCLHGGVPSHQREFTASLKETETFETWVRKFEVAFPTLRPLKIDKSLYTQKETSLNYFDEMGITQLYSDGDFKLTVNIVTKNSDYMDSFIKWWGENTTKTIPKGRVHVLISTSDGPEFKSLGIGSEPLIRENYSEEVLKGYDRMVADLTSPNPSGRVAILNGCPGGGKTFLIRGMLDEVKDVIFIIVPANLVQQLAQPGMIPSLVSLHKDRHEKPMCFIIEDSDEVIAPRQADNMSGVSNILNLGDGILGQLLDIHLICTTNQERTEVDSAILRPGRLSVSIEVRPLSQSKSMEIYKRLTGKEEGGPTGKTTLAEIYGLARQDGWSPARVSGKVGFVAEESPDGLDGLFE